MGCVDVDMEGLSKEYKTWLQTAHKINKHISVKFCRNVLKYFIRVGVLSDLFTICARICKYVLDVYNHIVLNFSVYEGMAKIIRAGSAVYTSVVVARSTGRW
jgi:hypothetical protein